MTLWTVLLGAGVVAVWLICWLAWIGVQHQLWLHRNRRRYGWWD